MKAASWKQPFVFLFLTALLSPGFAAGPLAAQQGWERVGPSGGSVREVVLHPRNPQVLWATTDQAGLFKSVNGGTSWTPVRGGLPLGTIWTLAVAPSQPDTLYAVAGISYGSFAVFRSSDGGGTWTQVIRCDQQPPCCGCFAIAGIRKLVVDPRDPRILYAAANGGVIKSVDGGARWHRTRLSNAQGVSDLTFDPQNPRFLYATGSFGVWRSLDGGATWLSLSNGIDVDDIGSLVIDPKNPNRMYAVGFTTRTVYRTGDGGAVWRRSARGLDRGAAVNSLALTRLPGRSLPILWAATGSGVYRSLDGGVTWALASPDLGGRTFWEVAAHPSRPRVLWAAGGVDFVKGGEFGIFRTADAGATWRLANRGLRAMAVQAVAFDSDEPNVLWVAGSNGIWRSGDLGATWAVRNGDLTFNQHFVYDLQVDRFDPDIAWIGTHEGVFVTEDNGLTWEPRNEGIPFDGGIAPVTQIRLATDRSTLYAALSGLFPGLYKSTDGGAHWVKVPSLPFPHIGDLLVDPRDPDILFVVAGALWISRDGGATWGVAHLETEPQILRTLAFDPRDLDVIYVGGAKGLFRSADGGGTWEEISRFHGRGVGEIAVTSEGTIWVISEEQILVSHDDLSTWTEVPGTDGVGVLEIEPHASEPETVYAPTTGGLLRRDGH